MKLHTFRGSYWLMFSIVLVVGALGVFRGEKIPVNNGFGFDGVLYAELARDFHLSGLSTYQIQRVVPSAVIHFAFELLGIPFEDRNIVLGFGIYNLLLLLLACYLWILVAAELKLSERGAWLGFTGLFINFANLKFAFYYPVITDVSAFALGMLMLLFFLRNSVVGLAVTTLVGAFTWPIIIYTGLPLLLFGRAPLEPNEKKGWLALAAAATVTAGALLLFIYLFLFKRHLRTDIAQSAAYVFPLSIAACSLYIFIATRNLLNGLGASDLYQALRSVGPLRLALGLLVLLAARLPILIFADPSLPAFTIKNAVIVIALCAIARPFVFIVSHTLYFGPIFLLLLFFWRAVCRVIRQYGPGLVLVTMLSILISLTPESRQSNSALPLVVPFLVKVLEEFRWRASFYWAFGLSSVLFSKVWFKINVGPIGAEDLLSFPSQYYFMNQGPWMSNLMYLVQGAVVALAILLFYWLVRRDVSVKAG